MTANSVHIPTVVMDSQYYDEEMQKTLTEESTYQPVEKDPTPQFERKMNAQVMSLKRSALSTPKWHSWEAQQSGFHYYMVHPGYNTDRMPRSTHCVLHDSQAYKMPKYLATELTGPNGWTTISYCTREFGAFCRVHQGASIVRGWDQSVLWCVVFFTCFPSGLTVKAAQWGLKDDPSLLERTDQSVEDVVGLLTLCLDATDREWIMGSLNTFDTDLQQWWLGRLLSKSHSWESNGRDSNYSSTKAN